MVQSSSLGVGPADRGAPAAASEPNVSDEQHVPSGPVGRRKRLRVQRGIYARLQASEPMAQHDLPDSDCQNHVEVQGLLELLKKRDAQIAQLRNEKRLLQQSVRRGQLRLKAQKLSHEKKVREMTDHKDFDLHRRKGDWEAKQSWS